MPRKGSAWTPLRLRRLAEKQAAWEEKAREALANGKKPVGRPPKERAQRLSQSKQTLRVRKSFSHSNSNSDMDSRKSVSGRSGSQLELCGDMDEAAKRFGRQESRASAAMNSASRQQSTLSLSWSRGELEDMGALDLPKFLSQSFEQADFANNPQDVSGLSAFRNDDGSVEDARDHEMNGEYSREQRKAEENELAALFCMVEEDHPMEFAAE